MKLTKFTHSCLYIQSDERDVLIDPGEWSELDFTTITNVDRLVITHNHPDHLNIDNIISVADRWPNLHIVCNQEVAQDIVEKTAKKNLVIRQTTACCVTFAAEHPSVPWSSHVAQNSGVHVVDQLTHPGDSLDFTETKRILALPINSAWASNKAAFEHVLELAKKPEMIIPIHDWHLNEEARADLYEKGEVVFKPHDINFIKITDGETFEV